MSCCGNCACNPAESDSRPTMLGAARNAAASRCCLLESDCETETEQQRGRAHLHVVCRPRLEQVQPDPYPAQRPGAEPGASTPSRARSDCDRPCSSRPTASSRTRIWPRRRSASRRCGTMATRAFVPLLRQTDISQVQRASSSRPISLISRRSTSSGSASEYASRSTRPASSATSSVRPASATASQTAHPECASRCNRAT